MKRVVIPRNFVKDLESCLSILGVCPCVLELGSLCLSKSAGVQKMCVWAVSRSMVR